jgi:hypothetical protein
LQIDVATREVHGFADAENRRFERYASEVSRA